MTTSEKIQDICDRIARDFHPDKIIVFGSHAYGTPGPFSDLDLLGVMPFEGSPLQQAARIITRINPGIGIDLIVRRPAQVCERLAMQDAVMRQILESGRVAYEANHALVDRVTRISKFSLDLIAFYPFVQRAQARALGLLSFKNATFRPPPPLTERRSIKWQPWKE